MDDQEFCQYFGGRMTRNPEPSHIWWKRKVFYDEELWGQYVDEMKNELHHGIREIVFCNYFIIDVCKNVYDIPIDISTQAGISRKEILSTLFRTYSYRRTIWEGALLERLVREKIFKQFNKCTGLLVQLLGYFREGKLLQRKAKQIVLDFDGIESYRKNWVPRWLTMSEFARLNLSKTLPSRSDINFFGNLHAGCVSHSQNPPVWLPSEERILQPKDTPRTQDQLIYLYWLREDIFSELVRNETTQINQLTNQKETQ